jgi:hypothetical protein
MNTEVKIATSDDFIFNSDFKYYFLNQDDMRIEIPEEHFSAENIGHALTMLEDYKSKQANIINFILNSEKGIFPYFNQKYNYTKEDTIIKLKDPIIICKGLTGELFFLFNELGNYIITVNYAYINGVLNLGQIKVES